MKPAEFIETDEQIEALGLERWTFGVGQPEYEVLPALVSDAGGHAVVTRWRPTEIERRALMDGACVDVIVLTYGEPLQPQIVSVQGVDYERFPGGEGEVA